VVRDPEVHGKVLHKVAREAQDLGLQVLGLIPSPLKGPAGNVEFFLHLRRGGKRASIGGERAVEESLPQATHYSGRIS